VLLGNAGIEVGESDQADRPRARGRLRALRGIRGTPAA